MQVKCSYPFADDIQPWMIWGYYVSPMMYGQNAIVINEFLDERWSAVRLLKNMEHLFYCFALPYLLSYLNSMHHLCLVQPINHTADSQPTVGKALLKMRGMFMEEYWYWISIGALVGFSLLFNVLFIWALTYLDRKPLLLS